MGLLLVTLQKSSELLPETDELLSLDQLSLGQDRSLHLAQHVRCHFGNQTLESQKVAAVLFLKRVDAPLQLLLLRLGLLESVSQLALVSLKFPLDHFLYL